MQLVEEAWLLKQRLAFRFMTAGYPGGMGDEHSVRLYRVKARALRRYYRRKRAMRGMW